MSDSVHNPVWTSCKDAAGIAGNIFAFGLFVSPIPTYRRIIRNRSTEQFSGLPYIYALMNCLICMWYGMPLISADNLLVVTVNSFGTNLSTFYGFYVLIHLHLLSLVAGRRNGGIQAGAKAIEEHLIEMEEIDVHLPVAPQEQDISEITGADTETIVPREKLTLENEVGTSTPLRQPSSKAGNFQFLAELISSYPDLIWETDEEKQSMFHIAVLHRHASIFNLIYELGSMKDVITAYKDHMGNNMLHLVAKLPDQNRLNMVLVPLCKCNES
ncbi:hypothetical protein H0E87_000593 [Populus deltoides]|uniref:Bidirectional sugar transporter SWEET n=1 Tax=Populus deltoides TaxID=3696 RepID=A0A8T2ZN85_POPDE|nr:hypothetical protein H0E87_000593 [Populus deltoides]